MSGLLKPKFMSQVPITAGTPLAKPADAIYVGGGGNATLVFADGTSATYDGLLAGYVYEFDVVLVESSGLTASNLVALYR